MFQVKFTRSKVNLYFGLNVMTIIEAWNVKCSLKIINALKESK